VLLKQLQRTYPERDDLAELQQTVFTRCLASDPGQSFRSVAELAEALARFAPARAQKHVERCAHMLNGQRDDEQAAVREAAALAEADLETLGIALTEPFGEAIPGAARGAMIKLALGVACAFAALVFAYTELASRAVDVTSRRDAARAAAPAAVLDTPEPQRIPAAPPLEVVVEQLDPGMAQQPATQRELPKAPAIEQAPARSATASGRSRHGPAALDTAKRAPRRGLDPATPPSQFEPLRPKRTALPSEPDVGF
jgi:hypothetical protein